MLIVLAPRRHDRVLLGALRAAYAGEFTLLHVWKAAPGAFPNAPNCFKRTKQWGHLIDGNLERLKAIATTLGVRRLVVSKEGQREQHVDLCGKPLERAISTATPWQRFKEAQAESSQC